VTEMLREKAPFHKDEWVEGEAWRNEPELGLFVILAKRHVGLLPASEPHTLSRGEEGRFRVAKVHPDGKLELSLRGHAYEEMEGDAKKILDALAKPGAPKISERMSPEDIRTRFGLSKKAFKRAVGRLLKEQAVAIDEAGTIALASKPARSPDRSAKSGR